MGRKSKPSSGFDVKAKLGNIQTLVKTKRPKEAIAYEFILFTMLCTAKFKLRRQPYESIRDYAMKMVKDFDMNPANLYPFIQKVEEAIYGNSKPSVEMYNQSIESFNKVFEEIVGKALPPEMTIQA